MHSWCSFEASLAAASSAFPAMDAAVVQATVQMVSKGCHGVVSIEVLFQREGGQTRRINSLQVECWWFHNATTHDFLRLLLGWAFKIQPVVQDCQMCWCHVLVFPTWGCVSGLQSCFSLKTKYQQEWTLCLFWEQMSSSSPATECRVFCQKHFRSLNLWLFEMNSSYRPSWCTLLVFTLSAGRLSRKPDRHEPDVTETAAVDGKCFCSTSCLRQSCWYCCGCFISVL